MSSIDGPLGFFDPTEAALAPSFDDLMWAAKDNNTSSSAEAPAPSAFALSSARHPSQEKTEDVVLAQVETPTRLQKAA